MSELAEATIAELGAALDEGRTSSVALTRAALDKAADPAGEGSRIFTRLYRDRALAMASASDALRAAGIRRSPIDGLPVSIKDLFDVAGEVTLAGSVAADGNAPASANAEIVDRLIAAGAVIVGRSNMTEFAFSGLGINPHYGTPLNPFDRQTGRIPGGSSSGAAVSVSDGMAVAGIGSDTGGSVRIPAALCGLAGFKPTARRVSTKGALPLSTTLDSVGPIARTVADCAVLDAVLSGDDRPLPAASDITGLRIAVPTTVVLDGMDETVADAFHTALKALRDAGALVSEIAIPEFAHLPAINAKGSFAAAEAWHWHRDLIGKAADRYDPRVLSRIRPGGSMSAAEYLDLIEARAAWIAAVENRIAGFDAVLMPTVPLIAPPVAALRDDDEAYTRTNGLNLRNPTFINFLDGCALSVPCHAPGMAPVGLMIAGPANADRKVIAVGQAVERVLAAQWG
ncbi:aspartyl-tRNA(Asn)/glutamyl-tRNA(Gln) amidotransferase subunit A [Faunimonas pinastri]|uniref:Indoleacetamide hydrolase n=1 Tax=Faunimonas pinastri TaxID=1855383 RepID=A0A1H9B5F1_9HYPH|nr:amidase [Faunimonas pinastri]SEP83931.1 aspartyl-tRNA(Asn)/glutamyl-tRNA(Gln) amidotransferase subunit A [Faunimonas pinastri]